MADEDDSMGDSVAPLKRETATTFFAAMKAERDSKEKQGQEKEQEMLAAMSAEERAMYLAKQAEDKKHEADKKKMLKGQMKRFSSVSTGKSGKGKGKGKKKKKGRGKKK